jgi:hypothetical protein
MYPKLTPACAEPSSSLASFSSSSIMHTHHIHFSRDLLYQSYKSRVSTEHTSLWSSYLVFHKSCFSKLHQVSARTDSFKREFLRCQTQLGSKGTHQRLNVQRPVVTISTSANNVRVGLDGSVNIATGYELEGPGIESRARRDFPHLSKPALGPTQPPVQRVPGLYRG